MNIPRSKLLLYIFCPVAAVLIFFGLFALVIRISVDGDWFWLPQPPVPDGALNPQTFFPSMGGQRDITFETVRSAEDIIQYYQKKLAEEGWRYLCSPNEKPDDGCPFWRSPGAISADIYLKNDPWNEHTIALEVFSSDVRQVQLGHHLVEITETYLPKNGSNPP